jgi:hypothetical protein
LLVQIFFTDEAMEKTKLKLFSAPMKRYNIPRSKSFTDEAIQLPSILENIWITAIKETEFSSRFGGKIGAAEEKSLAPL